MEWDQSSSEHQNENLPQVPDTVPEPSGIPEEPPAPPESGAIPEQTEPAVPTEFTFSPAVPAVSAEPPKKPKKAKTSLLAVLALFLSVALLIGCTLYVRRTEAQMREYEQKIAALEQSVAQPAPQSSEKESAGTTQTAPTVPESTQEALDHAAETIDKTSQALSTVISTVRRSVVCIYVTVPSQRISYGWNFYGETEEVSSSGSGIIWSSDGYIITNQHVIENVQQYSNAYITVIFDDGSQTGATLVAADSQTDIAVLKVSDKSGLPTAAFGTSKDLLVGQTAIAVGNPLGINYANSVTVGIVSGLNRKVSGENGTSTMIQTDAAVSPGNSGGALVDSEGKVIGVVSAKISSTDVEGIGFAIPIDDALKIASSLKEYGYVKDRPETGIAEGTEITSYLSRRYNLPEGLYVTKITKGSAADKAGLKQYDIILTFDGKQVTTLAEIEALKRNRKVGDSVPVTYYRDGAAKEATLVLGEAKG